MPLANCGSAWWFELSDTVVFDWKAHSSLSRFASLVSFTFSAIVLCGVDHGLDKTEFLKSF